VACTLLSFVICEGGGFNALARTSRVQESWIKLTAGSSGPVRCGAGVIGGSPYVGIPECTPQALWQTHWALAFSDSRLAILRFSMRDLRPPGAVFLSLRACVLFQRHGNILLSDDVCVCVEQFCEQQSHAGEELGCGICTAWWIFELLLSYTWRHCISVP